MTEVSASNTEVHAEAPLHFAFLMVTDYTLSPFANAVSVLRMANRQSGRELYRWSIYTIDGQAVNSSCGMTLQFDGAISAATEIDTLIVCGGYKIAQQTTPEILAALRLIAKTKIPIGALCTGAFVLAKAGLLDGYRCTIHWENLSAFREQFPRLLATSNLFVIDGNRYTCAGGVSSIDLMLKLVSIRYGHPMVQEISEQLACERVRSEHDPQRAALHYLIGANQPKLVSAVTLMEANIEEPLGLDELASYGNISRRQLERLFLKYLGCSPSRYYLQLRLFRARLLLVQTNMPIIDIAVSCGFSTAPHFSKCYHDLYGKPPRDERIALQ